MMQGQELGRGWEQEQGQSPPRQSCRGETRRQSPQAKARKQPQPQPQGQRRKRRTGQKQRSGPHPLPALDVGPRRSRTRASAQQRRLRRRRRQQRKQQQQREMEREKERASPRRLRPPQPGCHPAPLLLGAWESRQRGQSQAVPPCGERSGAACWGHGAAVCAEGRGAAPELRLDRVCLRLPGQESPRTGRLRSRASCRGVGRWSRRRPLPRLQSLRHPDRRHRGFHR